MTAHFRSSGDLIADRRFAYGRDYAADGDHAAAANLFEQALERSPSYAPAWFELGKARLATGHANAADAFRQAIQAEPIDELGASLHLARLEEEHSRETAMHPAYVEALFDQYAARFESHLVETLHYDGPALLYECLERACNSANRAMRFATLLDIGCGTGLAGVRFAPICGRLAGCDLSSRMIEETRRKGIYRELEATDALTFLSARETSADLILAADVLPYIDALAPLFDAVAKALMPGGFFAFSAQSTQTAQFELGADLRFHHSASYIEQSAQGAGLRLASVDIKGVRRDRGVETPGFLVVAMKE